MLRVKRGSPDSCDPHSILQGTDSPLPPPPPPPPPRNDMLPVPVNVLHTASYHFNSSSEELMREIASLEVKILHLERYLLSLYRTAFEQNLPALLENNGTYLQYDKGSQLQVLADQSLKGGMISPHQTSPPCGLAGTDNLSHAPPPKASSIMDLRSAGRGHRSLADHLGASCTDKALYTLDRLSEDIVKCISSIYCRLANSTSIHTGFSVSSTSSLSSSSTFSPRNLSDSWSSHFNGEATGKQLKEESRPYATMIEVSKICLDDDSFNYAAIMLQKLRSLVKSLEKADPGKMNREEKLVFWINIHNALVMHAYLAYGTHTNVRSTSILKAAYNVGGHCINAYIIQSSILGIRSHYSLPWLQTLLSPGKKFKMGSARHVYAIEYPEPLVHFALCSGAYSDPAVRVYKAKTVFQDLKLAKEEFVQASLYVHKETKIFLPKILDYFAKDMSLDVARLLEVVKECLSEGQLKDKAIINYMKGRPDKYIHWLPHRSTFQYRIHTDLAEGILSG